MSATVTGVGVVLPGADSVEALVAADRGEGVVDPSLIVGRKGLRYKDRATQLGYCAAAAALADAKVLVAGELTVAASSVAVVASSNFGNIDTVCRVLDTITAETVTGTSPMDLPNASSNVIASSIAIRFGLRGANLMLCNGPTSGLDAVHWAATLIRAGRVSRVLVVGVEPDNPYVRALVGAATLDGAVGLVVEDERAAIARGVAIRAIVGDYVRTTGLVACLARLAEAGPSPALWELPEAGDTPLPATMLAGVGRLDLGVTWGRCSGALGVVQCAAAVGWFAQGGAGPVWAVAGHLSGDATAGLVLKLPGASR